MLELQLPDKASAVELDLIRQIVEAAYDVADQADGVQPLVLASRALLERCSASDEERLSQDSDGSVPDCYPYAKESWEPGKGTSANARASELVEAIVFSMSALITHIKHTYGANTNER